jgi:hypothetical protein
MNKRKKQQRLKAATASPKENLAEAKNAPTEILALALLPIATISLVVYFSIGNTPNENRTLLGHEYGTVMGTAIYQGRGTSQRLLMTVKTRDGGLIQRRASMLEHSINDTEICLSKHRGVESNSIRYEIANLSDCQDIR